MNIIKIVTILYSSLRLWVMKITGKKVFYKNWLTISPRATLEVSNSGLLKISQGLHMKDHSSLSVRPGAVIQIGAGVFINKHTIITARKKIQIGSGVTIGPNVCIFDHDHDLNNRGRLSENSSLT